MKILLLLFAAMVGTPVIGFAGTGPPKLLTPANMAESRFKVFADIERQYVKDTVGRSVSTGLVRVVVVFLPEGRIPAGQFWLHVDDTVDAPLEMEAGDRRLLFSIAEKLIPQASILFTDDRKISSLRYTIRLSDFLGEKNR